MRVGRPSNTSEVCQYELFYTVHFDSSGSRLYGIIAYQVKNLDI